MATIGVKGLEVVSLLFSLLFVTVCWYVCGAGHTDTYSCYGPSSIIKYQGSYSSQGSAADTASLATPSSSVAVSQSFWSRPVGYARSVSVSLHVLHISSVCFVRRIIYSSLDKMHISAVFSWPYYATIYIRVRVAKFTTKSCLKSWGWVIPGS